MENFLLYVVLVVLPIGWWILSRRLAELERRIEFVSQEQVSHHALADVVRRVFQLEQAVAEPKAKPAPPPPLSPKPVATASPERPAPERVMTPAVPPPPAERAKTPAVPPAPLAPPRFEIPEPSRPGRSSEEWEALVGGNWLNKLGILVLVIAIALFLGYSFNHMGPAGVSSIALAMSIAILAGGVALERRARYVTFARGLLGGGWAALYFTTYAIQALDAAKIIYNPLLGGFLLLAVAAGMVIHSLRYRSQAVTGLAYAVAFATLAITPVTALSVIALVPLAASLLVIAYRFSWPGMVLFGLAATYCTCASRGDNGAPLWSAQTVFAAYWLLFEAYDILRARRRSSQAAEQTILPLNALGFAALSYAKWSASAPSQVYLLSSGIAAVYLASTVLRAVLRPPASFPPETATLERIATGGFEGPITLAAACSAVAAVLKTSRPDRQQCASGRRRTAVPGRARFPAGLPPPPRRRPVRIARRETARDRHSQRRNHRGGGPDAARLDALRGSRLHALLHRPGPSQSRPELWICRFGATGAGDGVRVVITPSGSGVAELRRYANIGMYQRMKDLTWLADSRSRVKSFPAGVQDDIGYALYAAQLGEMSVKAKPLHGLGRPVMEIAAHDAREPIARSIPSRLENRFYVVHAFQKKSKSGIATPKSDMELIRQQLKQLRSEVKNAEERNP